MAQENAVTTKEFAAETGATLRQLQWWDERGIIVPEFHGHRRFWDRRDIPYIRRVVALSGFGIPLNRIKPLADLKFSGVHIVNSPIVIGRTLFIPRDRRAKATKRGPK